MEPPLRIDWIDASAFGDARPGRLGLTILPGKHGPSIRYPGRVYRRRLEPDLADLAAAGVGHLLLLVTDAELERWGDADIVERAGRHGITVWRWPIPDGDPPASRSDVDRMIAMIRDARSRGDVAVACMGGVGRSGTVAACALVAAGWDAEPAIAELRRIRHPTAVETPAQQAFVRALATGPDL